MKVNRIIEEVTKETIPLIEQYFKNRKDADMVAKTIASRTVCRISFDIIDSSVKMDSKNLKPILCALIDVCRNGRTDPNTVKELEEMLRRL